MSRAAARKTAILHAAVDAIVVAGPDKASIAYRRRLAELAATSG